LLRALGVSSPLMIVGGGFSIVSSVMTIMTGRIVTDEFAAGRINAGACGTDTPVATKREE